MHMSRAVPLIIRRMLNGAIGVGAMVFSVGGSAFS